MRSIYQNAFFEGLRGTHFIESGKIEFKGVIFKDACEAISVLRRFHGETIVRAYHHLGAKGYEAESGHVVCITPHGVMLEYGSRFTANCSLRHLKNNGML